MVGPSSNLLLSSQRRFAAPKADYHALFFAAPGMGSVSRYCISHSAVPVIVVRPEAKVKKSQAKREKKDPKRKSYLALLGCVSLSATCERLLLRR